MIVKAEPLRELVRETFIAAGCSAEEAGRIAEHLVLATLTGHDSHGVIRVPRYLHWLRGGGVKADQSLTVITESDALALVDGNQGFGQTVGPLAVQLGIDKAREAGVAIVALRRSGHLGRIGHWAEMAAAAGQVSLHFVNVSGSLLVAPFGGTERRLSTNPVAIGVPRPGDRPLILDFATSVVAEGKVMVAYQGGKPLPEGALISFDGEPSNDPGIFYGSEPVAGVPDPHAGTGSIQAMGGHKGSGLSFMVEMLAGALTGSGTCGPGERPLMNGMLSIYMKPDAFEAGDAFFAEVRQYVEFFKSARPTSEGGEVLVPGEPEQRSAAKREAEGLPLTDETWSAILGAAREAGLSQERIDALVG